MSKKERYEIKKIIEFTDKTNKEYRKDLGSRVIITFLLLMLYSILSLNFLFDDISRTDLTIYLVVISVIGAMVLGAMMDNVKETKQTTYTERKKIKWKKD